MPRQRSETTIKKAEYARKLVEKKPDITQRDLANKIIERFETGLSFQILGNIKAGRDPFAKKRAKARRSKKRAKGGGVRDTTPYLVVLADETVISCESKASVRQEVARLVDEGADPADICVYSREKFKVEVRSKIKF